MAPYPEEIDVFSLPHTRMKELVDVYREKLLYTDFKDYAALESLLHSLHHTFCEFKSHEQIENKYIMRKLKKRLKLLSIHDATVCNCHSDNKLSDMLALVEDGYSCTSKPEAERINFGIKLQHALQEFTGSFLPHMKEEEEVFQPMLMKYFKYEELKCLKEQVIKEHSKWHTYDILNGEKIGCGIPENPFAQLPNEVMSHIMSFLSPKDLIRCSEVCRLWYDISRDPSLWKEIYPCFWAHDIWEDYDENHEDRVEKFYPQSSSFVDNEEFCDEKLELENEYSFQENLYNEQCKKELIVLQGMIDYLLPHVGFGVQKIVISSCKSLSSSLLHSLLILCPNASYLDISYTSVSDSAFKGLKEYSCCIKLEHLNMTGCKNITDLGLFRLADCMAMLPPDVPDGSRHLREVYLKDCQRFQGRNSSCLCEIEESGFLMQRTKACFKCISNDFCNSSCCWQKDGFMCHLAKLSLNCPYMNSGDNFPVQSRCSYVSPGASSIRKTTATFLSNSQETPKKQEPTSLKYLSLSGCSEITDDGLRCLLNAGVLEKLEYLDVSGCWLMTGQGLCSITDFLACLHPENLFYCDLIMDGPHPETSNGCQNLENGVRACCRQTM